MEDGGCALPWPPAFLTGNIFRSLCFNSIAYDQHLSAGRVSLRISSALGCHLNTLSSKSETDGVSSSATRKGYIHTERRDLVSLRSAMRFSIVWPWDLKSVKVTVQGVRGIWPFYCMHGPFVGED